MSRVKLLMLMGIIGALLLSACGGKQTGRNSPVEVKVVLNEFTIESSVTEFKPGVQYRFTVTNEGVVAHEFMIASVTMDVMEMAAMSMEQKDALALTMITEDKLPAGATAFIEYTFTSVPEGNMELICALPGHIEAGMYTPITVK